MVHRKDALRDRRSKIVLVQPIFWEEAQNMVIKGKI